MTDLMLANEFTKETLQSGLNSWSEMIDNGKIDKLCQNHDLTEHSLFVLFCMRIWEIFKYDEDCEDVEGFVYETAKVTLYSPEFDDYGDIDLAFDELLEKGFIQKCL